MNYIYSKKLFMEQMGKLLKEDEFVMISDTPIGNMTACSKKRKYKNISMAFGEQLFKEPNTISDLMKCKLLGLVVCKKNIISDKLKKEIDEYHKELKTKK